MTADREKGLDVRPDVAERLINEGFLYARSRDDGSEAYGLTHRGVQEVQAIFARRRPPGCGRLHPTISEFLRRMEEAKWSP